MYFVALLPQFLWFSVPEERKQSHEFAVSESLRLLNEQRRVCDLKYREMDSVSAPYDELF
jgi:hypothetical protein